MNPRELDLPNGYLEMERYHRPGPLLFPGYSTSPTPPLHFGSGPWMYPNPNQCYAPYAPPDEDLQRTTRSSPLQARARSSWSSVEEEILIRLYKENAEPMRKEGKRGQVLWKAICSRLNAECRDLGINSERTWQKCKEKCFNLSKKYKQAKDQMRVSGQGTEALDKCEHFEAFDEFMGSRDAVSPRHVVESGRNTPTTPPQEVAEENNADTAAAGPEAVTAVVATGKSGRRAAEKSGGRKKKPRREEKRGRGSVAGSVPGAERYASRGTEKGEHVL